VIILSDFILELHFLFYGQHYMTTAYRCVFTLCSRLNLCSKEDNPLCALQPENNPCSLTQGEKVCSFYNDDISAKIYIQVQSNQTFLAPIQIIQPTRCNSFTSLLLDVYVWLNTFRASPRPSSGAYNCIRSIWFYRWSVVVGALLVVVCQTTINNAPAASLQR
jgi:hypothetical protein